MDKIGVEEGILSNSKIFFSLLQTASVVLVIIVLMIVIVSKSIVLGPLLFPIALFPLLAAKLKKVSLKSIFPDIMFGLVGMSILTASSITGAEFAGVLGAVVGAIAGDVVADNMGGFFEGVVAEKMKPRYGTIHRSPFGSAMGKTTGNLLGGALVLTIAFFFRIVY